MKAREDIISGNAKVLRNINRGGILNIIRERQPISRVETARLTGLNKSTVSSIVAELLQEELIYEETVQDQNIGRNPILLRLKLGKHWVGAVNIDSAKTIVAIADIDGSIKEKLQLETRSAHPARFVEICLKKLFALQKKVTIQEFKGIGVSIAGLVDPLNLHVINAPNLGWREFDIGSVLRQNFCSDCILAVDNDAKAAALAELWFGTYEIDLSSFVFLSVTTGIGTGIIVDRKLVSGAHFAAGELGHMSIIDPGEPCSCGGSGCWEAYASSWATEKRYANRLGLDSGAPAPKLRLETIISRAKSGEPAAIETLRETGHFLGLGIANIFKTIDPETVIIGGAITSAWNIVYPEIIQAVEQRAFWDVKRKIRIFPTALTHRPQLLGAATLAIKEIFNNFKITR